MKNFSIAFILGVLLYMLCLQSSSGDSSYTPPATSGGSKVIPGNGITTNISGGNTTVAIASNVMTTNGPVQNVFNNDKFINGLSLVGSPDNSTALYWGAGNNVSGLNFIINTDMDTSVGDRNTVFMNRTAKNSGPGISLSWLTTNGVFAAAHGGTPIRVQGVISVNADGTTNYVLDYQACSFVFTPGPDTNSILRFDMPGYATIVQNGTENFCLADAGTINGVSQNYSDFWTDHLNQLLVFPTWDSTQIGTNMPPSMIVDHQNAVGHNLVEITNQLIVGTNLTIGKGPVVGAELDLVSGNMVISAGSVNFGTLSSIGGHSFNGGQVEFDSHANGAIATIDFNNGITFFNNACGVTPANATAGFIGTSAKPFGYLFTVTNSATTETIGTITSTNGYLSLKSNAAAPTSITVTASPFTFTAPAGANIQVYIGAGIVSAISKNSTSLASGLTMTGITAINLQAGETITVTYSSAPTMKYSFF